LGSVVAAVGVSPSRAVWNSRLVRRASPPKMRSFGVCRQGRAPVDGGTVRLPAIGESHAMDLILRERRERRRARTMGLANRIVRPAAPRRRRRSRPPAGRVPTALPAQDRLSALEQWDLEFDAALANETRRGLEVINSGETRAGAERFAAGAGRHGSFG
jgi:enoyl-CoA hydratase